MVAADSSATEYYVVPLGREGGGYLEFLGLDPDATEVEVVAGRREADKDSYHEKTA